MKKVECITRPLRLEAVKEALAACGVSGMTVTEVHGCGRQGGRTQEGGGDPASLLLPKVKVEAVIPDDKVEAVMTALADAARTGQVGDGKVFVLPVEEALRVRTGERGDAALT
jgi:nitrogen regulatory protein P-II 1